MTTKPVAVVSGAAGFIGSHMCKRLIAEGYYIVGLDNLSTGVKENVDPYVESGQMELRIHDVSEHVAVDGEVNLVLHLASPASPEDFSKIPIQILKVGGLGTHNMLGLAKEKQARFMLASTSEIYGDPLEHPQPESYWGNVNPLGPRGVYDESKRYAEAMTMAYHAKHDVDVSIVRIFNTYGPTMRGDDGRVVTNFISSALRGQPLRVHGDGSQTRSFCYVDDQIEGQWRLIKSGLTGPINIGATNEITVLSLAEKIKRLTSSPSEVQFVELPIDDPVRRCPDITLAKSKLDWLPETELDDGLGRTISYFKNL